MTTDTTMTRTKTSTGEPGPDVGVSRGKSGVEILRSVSGVYSWKVAVVTDDDSEKGLRAAKALAAQIENELREEYRGRHRT